MTTTTLTTYTHFARILINNWVNWGSTLYDPQNVQPEYSTEKAILCLIDHIRCPEKMKQEWEHFTFYNNLLYRNDISYDEFKTELPESLRIELEEERKYYENS